MAHDLVTELLQYSSLACFMPIWQLCANMLIPNCLRSNLSYSPLAALELYVKNTNTLLHSCEHFSTMLPVAVTDATILPYNGAFYLFATSRNAYNKDLYMWTSNNRLYGYDLSPILIKSNLFGSRMAGDFMYVNNTVYRPAQDCLQGYGKGIILYKVEDISDKSYNETKVISLYPDSSSYYSDGLHTINFYKSICVIDGYKNHYIPFQKIYRKLFDKYRS